MTDILDALGLLLVAAGVAGGAWLYIGPWALCVAGLIIIGASAVAARSER